MHTQNKSTYFNVDIFIVTLFNKNVQLGRQGGVSLERKRLEKICTETEKGGF